MRINSFRERVRAASPDMVPPTPQNIGIEVNEEDHHPQTPLLTPRTSSKTVREIGKSPLQVISTPPHPTHTVGGLYDFLMVASSYTQSANQLYDT
jgi:hypothetical protein